MSTPAPVPSRADLDVTLLKRRAHAGTATRAVAFALLCVPVGASAQPRQAPLPIEGNTTGAVTTSAAAPVSRVPQPPAADSTRAALGASERPSEDEAAILDAINALRAAASLGPLVAHAGLMRAARQHSAEMAQNGTLTHVSPTTGTPADRAAAAGVRALRVTQNISRRPTASAAHEAILASDAHRAQLLDAAATHVGIGLWVGADGVYLTELMARMVPEPELPPPSVADVPQPSATPPSYVPGRSAQPPALAEAEEAELYADPEVESAPPAGAPLVRAQPDLASAPPAQGQASAQVQSPPAPTTGTLPTLRITQAHRGVAGYWLFHEGRWWYFPIPPGTRQGQLLYPDTRVQGAPPGYQGTPQAQTQAQVPARVQPPVTTAPRGYWRLTPQ